MLENKKQRVLFRETPEKNICFSVVDLLLVVVSFLLTGIFLDHTAQPCAADLATAGLIGVFVLLLFWCFDMYSPTMLKPYPILVTTILSAIYTFVCVFLVLFLVTRRMDFLPFLALGTLLSYLLLCIRHIANYQFRQKWVYRPKMLIVETNTADASRVKNLKQDCMSHYDPRYVRLDIASKACVQAFIEENVPEYDVICLMETIPLDIRDLFMEAVLRMNKELYIVPTVYELSFTRMKPAYLDDVLVFRLGSARISPFQRFLKRSMDIVFSAAALAVACIPMCIIALLIKLTSPGPVFYKQLRLTKDKKEFYIYKFRSMVHEAESLTGPALATKDDPRITAVGKWLRMLRLDELPQLINILCGDMSIVGPRPERPYFVEQYEKEIPNYNKRFMMKAGLTALSHVYGRYSTDIVDRTHYDLLYVQNYSILMDIRIMLLTSRTLFLSDAAEGVQTEDPRAATNRHGSSNA